MANNNKSDVQEKKSEADMDDTEARTKTLTAEEQAVLDKQDLDEQAIDPSPIVDV